MQHAQTVLSRNEILNAVWGFDYDGDTRIIDVHTFKLRGKLSSSKAADHLIQRHRLHSEPR